MPHPSALRSKIRSAFAEETRGAWRLEVKLRIAATEVSQVGNLLYRQLSIGKRENPFDLEIILQTKALIGAGRRTLVEA